MIDINPHSLALIGALMIATFMALIMTKKMSPIVALILVPSVFGLLVASPTQLGQWMVNGIEGISKTGVMLCFAILYFSIMIEVGLFEPLVNAILRVVKGDPVKVLVGTAVLSMLVSLDGDGATTYLVVTAAFLPLYKKMGINPLKLTTIVMLSGGIFNILPWGGPTARVMASLKLGADQVFLPLIPCMAVACLYVIGVAFWLGKKEQKRLGIQLEVFETITSKKPKFFWFNLALTTLLMVALLTNFLPITVIFLVGFALAILVNFPKIEDERERINAFAGNALTVASMVFAAGIFAGVAKESGMLKAMGDAMTSVIPSVLGSKMAVITAGFSAICTFFMTNDGFYFGILPTLTETAAHFGVSSAEMARASLIGQPVHLLSPLVPSTYLLVGLAEVEFGDHLKHTLKWAIGTVIVMTLTAVLTGII